MPPRSTYITIRISPSDKALLSKLCSEVHIYQSTYVNLLIQAELAQFKHSGVPSFALQAKHHPPHSC